MKTQNTINKIFVHRKVMDPFSVTFETALLTGGTKVMHRVCVVHFCATDKKPKRAVYNIIYNIYIIYIYPHIQMSYT